MTATPTELELGTVTTSQGQQPLIRADSDGQTVSFTEHDLLPGHPFRNVQAGSKVSFLRSGSTHTDMENRPVASRVSLVDPSHNAALPANVAAQNAKANVTIKAGSHRVTPADAAAAVVTIGTGLTIGSAIVQITHDGEVVTADARVVVSGGNVSIRNGLIYALTVGDSINWIVSGA